MKTALALLIIAACSSSAYATCFNDSPVALAKVLREKHREFYQEPSAEARQLIHPAFLKAIDREDRCIKANDICSLDAEPWDDAQDGEATPPFEYKVMQLTPTESTVQFNFRFTVDNKHYSHRHTTLKFKRDGADNCWKVDDLITFHGQSLHKMFLK
ncbi:hypothetical protein [Andreprevotia chitinilytica]|uniref:hypothetical protein n=1 Tax=Andreprevotia chitinilytica TaxID=396808 RepID=UPI000558382F|nr:hypothetical protein [Andreprevotia chitinilytica]